MLGKRSRDVSIGFPGKPESESNSDEGENLGSLSSPWLQPHPSFFLTFLTVTPGLSPGCKRYHYLIYILFFIPGILPSEDYFFSWRRKKCLLTQLHYVLSPLVMSNSLQPHGQQPTRLHCPWRFSRQEYWSGLPCPPPGALPNPGIQPMSAVLQADYLLLSHVGSPLKLIKHCKLTVLQYIIQIKLRKKKKSFKCPIKAALLL